MTSEKNIAFKVVYREELKVILKLHLEELKEQYKLLKKPDPEKKKQLVPSSRNTPDNLYEQRFPNISPAKRLC